jgi:Family of unknown function (DUF6188)
MDLGFEGQALEAVKVDYTVGLEFSHGYYIRVENDFVLTVRGIQSPISPENDSADSTTERLQPLASETVTSAVAHDNGILVLTFANAATLQVEPDAQYEAWTFAGPKGAKVVCMPGGELAIWSPKED